MKEKALSVILWVSEENPALRKVLLLKVVPDRGGFWQTPTGHLEQRESFLEAALRESEEETGLQGFRFPQFLGLDYSFDSRWGNKRERAYLLIFPHGNQPPTIQLDRSEHVEYQWLDYNDALSLLKFENNREALVRACTDPMPLYLSSRGEFYHEGTLVTHEKTIALFHRSMEQHSDGYRVRVDRESLRLYPETYAFFIKNINIDEAELTLLCETKIPFKPENLRISAARELLYLQESGRIAKFLSPPYYELANFLIQQEDSHPPKIQWNGKILQIPTFSIR